MTNLEKLNAVLQAATGPVLLDFDGPITLLLPQGPNLELAEEARSPLVSAGIYVPQAIAETSDHLAVLRFAADNSTPSILTAVEEICDQGEERAALKTPLTDGAKDVLLACRNTARPVAIVSNNTATAITAFLEQHCLAMLVQHIIGRPTGHPELMKPEPYVVLEALRLLGAHPAQCVFVGDQVTDILVSNRTKVRSIGFAKHEGREDDLIAAGADAIILAMDGLARALVSQASLRS